jgi:hypothetical protein
LFLNKSPVFVGVLCVSSLRCVTHENFSTYLWQIDSVVIDMIEVIPVYDVHILDLK